MDKEKAIEKRNESLFVKELNNFAKSYLLDLELHEAYAQFSARISDPALIFSDLASVLDWSEIYGAFFNLPTEKFPEVPGDFTEINVTQSFMDLGLNDLNIDALGRVEEKRIGR